MDDKDQVIEEVGDDQSSNKQSEETKEETPTLEKVAELAKGLQKGYTLTRQEMSEIKANLQTIADQINAKSQAQSTDEEYVTVGKLREVLTKFEEGKAVAQEQKTKEAEGYIDSKISEFYADGIIANKQEEDDLLDYAYKNQITNLDNAAAKWLKTRGASKISDAVKAKARQGEGSKVGSSSKTTQEEQGGVDYKKVKKMDWFNFW